MPEITEPGVYSVPAAVYHADDRLCPAPSLSSTGARKLVAECPAVYWHERNNPPEPSEAMRVGSAAHEWLLEGETWPARHFVLPDDHNGRTSTGKAVVAEAEAAGLRVITADQFATIQAMHDALAAHPFAMKAFSNGAAEQTVIWRDEEFGIWCRCRPDFLPSGSSIVADYKTAASVHPTELRKSIAAYGYAQQAAWYLDGIQAAGAIAEPRFLFIFQAKTAPYLIVPVVLSDIAIGWGRVLNRRAKSLFAHGLSTGEWPGYADDVLQLDLPGWTEAELQRQHEAGAFEPVEPVRVAA